jgi:chromosome partitioning protein
MRRIAIASAKGGTGKTTMAVTLAHGLALSGLRVGLVDLDVQGHAALTFGLEGDGGVASLLRGEQAHCVEVRDSLWVIQSGGDQLASQERRMPHNVGSVGSLRRALQCADAFDVMILDCPASSRLLQMSGLAACDEVVLPVGTDPMSLRGAQVFLKHMHQLTQATRVRPRFLGILPNLYDASAESTGVFERRLREEHGGHVLQCRIGLADELRRAPSERGTVFDTAPLSRAALDYALLTQEILDLAA